MSPDGTRMAVSGRPAANDIEDGGGISLWDVTTPQPKHVLNLAMPGRRCQIMSVAFSPDNQEIAAGIADQDLGLFFFDANTGQELRRVKSLENCLTTDSPADLYSPDGSGLVTLNLRKEGRTRGCSGIRSPAKSFARIGPNGDCRSKVPLTFSPAGDLFATTGVRNRVAIDIFRVADQSKIATWGGFDNPIESFVFTPDGRRIIVKCAVARRFITARRGRL